MWQILNMLKSRKPEDITDRAAVKQLTCLSLPLKMNCRNRRTRANFHLTTEQMTTSTLIFITPHYLDPGDELEMTLSPDCQIPGVTLRGRVASCKPRKASGYVTFEGVVELSARGGLNLEIFRLHAESQNRRTRHCA